MNLRLSAALALILLLPVPASAYSVLAHEAVIDATWEASIRPILAARFPASEAELRKARAFAYGGCLIQDLGFYPFSSRFFGNLTHYVRSGDFVEALLREAQTGPELAFALGALAHVAADTRGHALAVNRAVPLIYPKLRAKSGDEITYEEHPAAHLKTEFGFDVLQVARGRYAPDAFHDFIGFEVARDLLARAFRATYALEIDDVFGNLGLAIGTFRWTVSGTIPEVTKVAWETRRKEIDALSPGGTREAFLFASSRADFERRWGTEYKRPGFMQRVVSWILRIVPRVGPFRALAYRTPTPEAERLFLDSFNRSVERYRALLQSQAAGTMSLDNRNLDTGDPVTSGQYRLADETYAELLERLGKDEFRTVTASLRVDLLRFFAPLKTAARTDTRSRKTLALLAALERR
ncbi:MAG TPA: zinc dependent phospholipase C family protein [Vicinamibacterales bacterium]|nr:zinc dependent phospholipase C family protein [Vicinamibacterales bacterium]